MNKRKYLPNWKILFLLKIESVISYSFYALYEAAPIM